MQLIKQSKPYSIPTELKEILTSMKLEYGTGGGVGEVLPATRFWSISFDDGNVAGYTWLAEHLGPDGIQFHINIAVLPQYNRRGAASFALAEVERKLDSEQIPALYGQVNSNKPDTGRWVRLWLLRCDFQLLRQGIPEYYLQLSDENLAKQCPRPIFFRKELVTKGTQPLLERGPSQAVP